MATEKNITVDDMTALLFGGKEQTGEGIKERVKFDFDKRKKDYFFVLIEENEWNNVETELEGNTLEWVIVWMIHKWQTSYDYMKKKANGEPWENVYSKYYLPSNKGKLTIYEKVDGTETILREFGEEKEVFEMLANKSALSGNEEKLGHMNRINVLFVYIPKLDKVVRVFVPYLSMAKSELSELLKNGAKLTKHLVTIGAKSIKNKKNEDTHIFTFKLGEEHKIGVDIISDSMKKVFTYLK